MTTTLVFTHSGFTRPGDHAIYAQTDAYCVLYDDPDPANNTYGPVTTTVPFVTVTAADPAGNGLSVATSDAISATFSTTIDAGTVSTRTFTVWGQQTGVYTQSYAVAGNTVTFDAQPDYKPGEDVVVSLNSDLRGVDGSWLVPHAWQFQAGVNGGTGVFTETGGALGSDWPFYELELADVDGDGDLDALVDVDPIEIWLNDGTGTFTDSGNTIDSTDLQAIALGDLDGDGDLDAVLGKSGFPGTPNQDLAQPGRSARWDARRLRRQRAKPRSRRHLGRGVGRSGRRRRPRLLRRQRQRGSGLASTRVGLPAFSPPAARPSAVWPTPPRWAIWTTTATSTRSATVSGSTTVPACFPTLGKA